MTMIASLPIRANVFAIDGLCQDPGAGSFADPPGAAEEESVRQLAVFDGVFQGSGDMGLADHRREVLGPVFSGRNDELIHFSKPSTNPQILRQATSGLPIFKKNIPENLIY